jgi:ABC-type Mn2+/Zn2+ transport system permease subunit
MGRRMLAASLGGLSGVVGLYISFYVGIASGPAIVLVATVLFVLVQPARALREVSVDLLRPLSKITQCHE